MMGVFNSLHQDVPTNAGSFRRLRIHLRENCVVGIPRHPTSCSVATTNVADRVANAIHKAMATLGDGVGMAESGPTQPPAWGVISGVDPRSGAPFINQIMFAAVTCGGASPVADGYLLLAGGGRRWDALARQRRARRAAFPAAGRFADPAARHRGCGRRRGAPAAYVEYGPVGSPLEVMYASDGTIHNPEGVRGGLDGSPARQYRRDTSGQLIELPNCARVVLQTGETIISYCCGGGGYGDPLTRETESVAEDVLEGYSPVREPRLPTESCSTIGARWTTRARASSVASSERAWKRGR